MKISVLCSVFCVVFLVLRTTSGSRAAFLDGSFLANNNLIRTFSGVRAKFDSASRASLS